MIVTAALLFVIELLYFRVAKYYNIIDKPNARSLHSNITIRGGGIIFWIAYFFGFIKYQFSYIYFFIGFTILVLISFLDDILTLPSRYRLWIQVIAISCLFYQLGLQNLYDLWILFLLGIVGIGILNAYNFMDGLNGITGAYSLIVLITLLFVNKYQIIFIENELILIIISSILVFLFFNFRIKALCFGGDVGSVGLAFVVLFLISKLMLQTNDFKYIFFLTLYGLDTIYTIVYRLTLKQNIFEAHKLHFFQMLVYKYNWSHLVVSTTYAILQVGLNIWIINHSVKDFIFYIPIFILLIFMHFLRKKVKLELNVLWFLKNNR